jgi:hypothetical protein
MSNVSRLERESNANAIVHTLCVFMRPTTVRELA